MNLLRILGWGFYLTCSWTWCIGMFLPVVVLHRYGWEGFLMFAIPNVLGCAAFGYVVRTPEQSKAIVAKYGGAIALFSIITMAFHVFFVAMIVSLHVPESTLSMTIVIPAGILLLGIGLAFVPSRVWPILAVALWVFSLLVGMSFLPLDSELQGSRPLKDVLWLLPITTFGFFLSPYLDPTFHKALQCSPNKHSFGVFGVAFAIMIAVTCSYQHVILASLPMLLLLHLGLQSIFTIGAHAKEGWRVEPQHRKMRFVVLCFTACAVAIGVSLRPHGTEDNTINDYLRFFVFYGLVFPGLVATFMLTGRKFSPLRVSLFTFVALLSLPLLELAYIGNSTWLSVLPVVILLTWAFADRPSKSISTT